MYTQIFIIGFSKMMADRHQIQEQSSQARLIEKASLAQKLVLKNTINEKSEIMIAKFGHEDALLATGSGDGHVRIYNLIKSVKITQFNTNIKDKQSHSNTPVNALRWRPQSQKIQTMSSFMLAANTNGHIFQFIAKTGKQVWHGIESDNQIFALDYVYDSQYFASAGSDNVIRIYDEHTKKITHNLKGQMRRKQGHNNRLFSVKFKHQDHNLLASGGWDQNINIWDMRVGQVTATIVGPKITGDSIDFRDNLILTGANKVKDQLQLWDFRTQKVLHTYLWDQNKEKANIFLDCCQFSGSSHVIAAGYNQMKMFSIQEDYAEIFELRGNKKEAFYTCDSSWVNNKYLAAGKEGKVYYVVPKKIQV